VANDKNFVVKNGLDIGTSLKIAGTTVTSSAAELNILDGVTADYAELNLLDTAVAGTVVNSKAVIYGAAGQVNATTLQIAGTSITSSAVELNYNDITTLGTVQASKTVTADSSLIVKFPDNAKAVFGDSSDLQIYHDGTDSYINDAGTGNLRLAASQIDLLGGTDGAETMATFVDNGAVTLYYDNASKFATTSTGVSVTGDVYATTFTSTGNAVIGGDLTVNGTTTTVNSTIVSIDDKNIELGAVASPSNTTADGGGITLKGLTDKTFNWVNSTSAWTSSEHLAVAAGKTLLVSGSSTGTATITAPATAGTPTLTLPTSTGTFARLEDNLGAFAATTSSQLAGVISDETGSGALVFASSPTLSGIPLAPTASVGTNTTQIATTAFVRNEIATVADTNTTYDHLAATTTGGALLRLHGSDSTNDDVKFASGTNVTVAYTDANTITISSTDTNTTYDHLAVTTTGGALLRLHGSDSTNDDVKFASGTAVTVAYTDANTITIDHTDTSTLTGAQGSAGIASLTVDTYGHVTAVTTATYLTSQSSDFKTITVTDTDTGYTWLTTGNAVAASTGDTLTIVDGTGIDIDADATSKAIRIQHTDTSTVANLTASSRTYVTALTFDTYGHVTAYSTASETVTDTNTTYSQAAVTTTGGAFLRLTGSDSTNDDVKFASGTAVTVSFTDANTITVDHTDTSTLLGAQGSAGIASLTVDTYGHVTAVTTATYLTSQSSDFGTFAIGADAGYTWGTANTNTSQVADTTGDTLTLVRGLTGSTAGIDLFTNTVVGTDAIKIAHADTSTLSGAQGSAGIAAITVDEMGHVTAVTTATYLTSQSTDFKTVTVTDTDTGYTWSTTGNATASITGDTLTVVDGTGIDIDADATSKAIRIQHTDTSTVSNLSATSRTYVSALTFDTYGHVTAYSTASETVTDTNTTYDISAVTTTGGALLRLNASTAVTDDVKFASGTNVTVAYTDANTITINSSYTDTNTTSLAIKNSANTAQFTATDTTGLQFAASGIATVAFDAVNYRVTVTATEADTLDSVTGRGATTANNITVGDIAVNGGDITTNQTTFNIANTNATTVGAFNAATALTLGYTSTAASTTNISTGAVAASTTKVVNLGTGGVASSVTNINIGATTGGTSTIASPNITLSGLSPTATAATHYYVQTASGDILPKTLANTKTEIVTTAAVNSAAATTVGTITSGTWNGGIISPTYGGTGVNNGTRTITLNTGNLTLTAQAAGSSVTVPATGTLATTSNKLSDFAATTSAELAGVISDETGSGLLVFATAPTFTTTIDGGATFGAFASSTALTLGYTGTAASTTNISTGAIISGQTKTINIGTGGVAGSTSTINIGIAAGGTTTVNNNLTVGGNLTVNGTTTTVNSTTVTIDDPIFTIGGDTAPAADDNKDRGIEFRWHNGTAAKVGFFGFDDSTGYFTFIPDATNTSEVFSGTTGVLDVASITGSAAKWTTARTATVTLTGDVTGTAGVSVDGSANWTNSLTTTVGWNTAGNYAFANASIDLDGVGYTWGTVNNNTTQAAESNTDTLTLVRGLTGSTAGIELYTSTVAGTDAIKIAHADTSTLSGAQGSAGIAAITVDEMGHVTAVTTATYLTSQSSDFGTFAIGADAGYTWGTANTNTNQVADTTGDTLTLVRGLTGTTAGIDLFTNTVAGTDAIKIAHADTSTLTGAQGTAGIASFTVDEMGHVTAVTTATYLTSYTETDTLATVTGRGASTSTQVVLNGGVTTTTTTSLTLDSGTTGAVNIGTSANAKTLTIGNVTGATGIVLNSGTAGVTVNNVAAGQFKVQSSAAPTADMVNITNTGFANVTAGVSALQVTYVGGAAAVEASAARIDLTPGATSSGTWNGLRLVPSAAAAASVTVNLIKADAITAGAGTDNVILVGTGYDNILNYNGTTVINGTGNLIAGQLSGTIPSAVLGNSSLFVGTTSIALNRTTGSQTLTGVSIDGNAATVTNGALTTGTLAQFAATTSSQLAGVISDETGSGALVFATSPSLTTPTLGVASATSINKVAITAPATGSTLTIADGKTLTVSNTLTFTGTDTSSVAFGTGGTVAYTGGTLAQFAATTSSQLAGVISDETGSGVLVFATSPTFTTSIDSGATFGAFASSTALTLGYTGTAASTTNISTGAVAASTIKAINIGTGGAASSTTNIVIGTPVGGTTTIASTGLTLSGLAATATAATHYYVQTTGGNLLPKTLANATTELVTTAAVNSAAATTVGTITSGTWNGTIIGATYGGTGVNNGTRTITLNTGNLTLTAQAAGSSVTVPATGTLATTSNKLSDFAATTSAELAGVISDETGSGALVFGTSPTITTPTITFSTSATVTAGTNAQGQGALTSDYNVVTTTTTAPSGVTLPVATVGRRITVVNKGTNSITIYPATGGTIDALALNAAITLPINQQLVFKASSTTQWYSTYGLLVGLAAVASAVAANSVTLGTDTVGNYVATVAAGTPGAETSSSGLTIVSVAGEGTATTVAHADTSTLTGAQGSAGIASLTVDGYGHVTAVTTATYLTSQSSDFGTFAIGADAGYTWGTANTNTSQVADATGDTLTIVRGLTGTTAGIDLFTNTVAGTDAIKIAHADTSTLTGAQGSAGIASFTVDEMGHVTAVTTATYLTAEADTLATVTGRGASTSTQVVLNGGVTTTTTTALTLDSGTTGAVNIGTNANAKTLTLGNVTGATGIVLNSGTAGVTVNTVAAGQFKVAATAAPTVDMVNITNTGFGTVTAGTSALQVTYVGGAAAVEASAARIDLTPGATASGTWNGLRLVPSAAAATSVTVNLIKADAITAGAGTDNVLLVGTGYDNILNYNGTTVINGTGNVIAGQLSGTIPSAVLGNSSLFVGTTSIALNRATGSQSLTGVSIDGNAGTVTNGFYTTGGTLTGQFISTDTYDAATGGGNIYLNSTTGNRIDFNVNGVAAPAFTTRSAGTKVVYYPAITAAAADYAVGINTSTLWHSVPTAAATEFFRWYGGTTVAASLTGAGTFTATGDVCAYSDISLKENIEVISDPLTKVLKLRGVTFTRKDLADNKTHMGVIAQEVEEVIPEVVITGEDGIKTVAYGNMVGLLIEAVKKLSEQNTELMARIEKLEQGK
jgi:hypothetical protein